jgi:hypothetical protein
LLTDHYEKVEKMVKNHQEKAKTIKKIPEDEMASAAVLRVVGEDIDSTYSDVEEHASSLDLPVRLEKVISGGEKKSRAARHPSEQCSPREQRTGTRRSAREP